MAWEVIAGLSLVVMALFFLPRYLKSGIATVPQFLETRFDSQTRAITSLIFIIAYAGILLPIVLYTGARGLTGILNMPELTGIPSEMGNIWLAVWLIGILGSIYAIFGGLRTVAVSDTLNGMGLLAGGILITIFGLLAINRGNPALALETLNTDHPEKFNSLGPSQSSVPFSTLFTGVLLINLFYWCTNQQIIQRTFAASTLKEGQKGVLLAGGFKVVAPIILVIPGIIAFHLYGQVYWEGQRVPIKDITRNPVTLVGKVGDQELILHGQEAETALGTSNLDEAKKREGQTVTFADQKIQVEKVLGKGVVIVADNSGQNHYLYGLDVDEKVSPRKRDRAYGVLVRSVLPPWLTGFFAAVMVGAILSSFNSALNSTATLFSLGVYQHMLHPGANDKQIIRAGQIFAWALAILSMTMAPFLANVESIFGYLQKMNGLYFIPIFSVVLVGMLSKRVPAFAANLALVLGFVAIALGYFVPPLANLVDSMNEFHFLGAVFVTLVVVMLIIGKVSPRSEPWVQQDSGEVDLTPWKWAWPAGLGLAAIVLTIYVYFADLSFVLGN